MRDQSLATGWETERFRREGDKMKSLGDYLNPPTFEDQRNAGAARLVSILERMEKKGTDDGAR